MDELAIVILNFNGRHFLEKFLPGINQLSAGFPVYIADNGSTDDSVEFLERNHPQNRIIRLGRNEGFAGGYNAALSQVDARYYILVNSDIEVTAGWIDALLDFMEQHPDYAACQPKIRSFHNREYFEYAGAGGGYIDRYGYPFCRGRIFKELEKDEGQYSDEKEVFWASGACMIIRSEVFHQAGGFDAGFFAHMEEIDMCWRLKKSGWKVGYTGKSTVFHVGGGTLSAGNPFKTYLNFRNNLAMLIKNLDRRELLSVLPVRLFLDLAASFKFLIFDSPGDAWAVIRGLAVSYLGYRTIRRKRLNTEDSYPNKKLTGICKKSVVLAYYIWRKKKFPSLGIQ